MKIKTTRFGEVEIDDNRVISFPRGILGFDRFKSYFLMDYKDTPIKWLQSTENPDVAFMVVDPLLFFQDYVPELSPVEKNLLEVQNPADLAVLAIMNVNRNQDPPVTLNLQAPLVLNATYMKGFQIVLENSKFGVREVVAI